MTAPRNFNEYRARFLANQRIFGYGLATSVGMPCPFCAAPDWLVYRAVDCESAFTRGGTCKECHRSARAVVNRTSSTVRLEFFQTSGPPQPEWLLPQMRRWTNGS